MSFFTKLKAELRTIANISDHIDTEAAARNIRGNIAFRGPNVWILAFSIIIASVGLNVNSTAVIIGAMLISPLMGPIIGIGLGLGVNDTTLIKDALKNLFVMVSISLLASLLYFLLTPLKLANPTELLARTNPTIYDVLIALFGGAAGMLEISRKDKGTVLSGVAIATALMPPLCTAGYGLASLKMQYFLGALLLFIINGVFIILASYLMSKILGFKEISFQDARTAKRTRTFVSVVMILVMVPSIWSAVNMIRANKFTQNAQEMISEIRTLSNGYIYNYEVDTHKGGKISLYIAGSALQDSDREKILLAAKNHGIDESRLEFFEHKIGPDEDESADKIMKGLFERTDSEISKKEAQIRALESELMKYRQEEIPYLQVSREVSSLYPQIRKLTISRGAEVSLDSLNVGNRMLVVAESDRVLDQQSLERMTELLKLRLNDTTVLVLNTLSIADKEQNRERRK